MSSSRDTERLLATLLSDAREAPTPEDLKRVELRLGTWLGPDRAPARPARSSGRSLAWKAVLAVAGVGLLSYVFHDASPPPGDLRPEVAPSVATILPVAPSVATILPVAPEPSPGTSVHIADLPSVAPALPGASSALASTTAASTGPRSGARPRSGHVGAPAAEASAVVSQPAGEAESEASFLRRTRAALAGDPARALRMTEEHASRFPRGVLVQERDVIAIDALVRLGRHDEARTKAASFRARYPSSAHASRISAIVGTE